MLCTINTIIHTLLFHARLPHTYQVEAFPWSSTFSTFSLPLPSKTTLPHIASSKSIALILIITHSGVFASLKSPPLINSYPDPLHVSSLDTLHTIKAFSASIYPPVKSSFLDMSHQTKIFFLLNPYHHRSILLFIS